MSDIGVTSYDLTTLPSGAVLSRVTAEPVTMSGKTALKVRLTKAAGGGRVGVDFGDEPTFVLLPSAFGIAPSRSSFSAGSPPEPRRRLQYFAYPDWKFDRPREAHPDGRYETGADIAPDEWLPTPAVDRRLARRGLRQRAPGDDPA
jgi:hypothetical protein